MKSNEKAMGGNAKSTKSPAVRSGVSVVPPLDRRVPAFRLGIPAVPPLVRAVPADCLTAAVKKWYGNCQNLALQCSRLVEIVLLAPPEKIPFFQLEKQTCNCNRRGASEC